MSYWVLLHLLTNYTLYEGQIELFWIYCKQQNPFFYPWFQILFCSDLVLKIEKEEVEVDPVIAGILILNLKCLFMYVAVFLRWTGKGIKKVESQKISGIVSWGCNCVVAVVEFNSEI